MASASSRTLRDPWKYAAEYWPRLPITRCPLPDHLDGYTEWREGHAPAIYLSTGLDDTGVRTTLTHELLHVEFGDPDRDHATEEEGRIRVGTARWLLPDLGEVVDALTRAGSVEAAAEWLWVTGPVLLDRLRHLTLIEAREFPPGVGVVDRVG